MEANKNYKIEIEIQKNDKSEYLKKETLSLLEQFKKDVDAKSSLVEIEIISIFKTKQGAEHDKDKCFNQDAIKLTIPYIQEAGYFVWRYKDYKGQTSYCITNRKNTPHTWYSFVNNED